jgi:hypothetical protein
MMIPITALIAVPPLDAAWQRQKSRREAPSGLAIFEYSPEFWMTPAILAVAAFVVRSCWELVILRELRSR